MKHSFANRILKTFDTGQVINYVYYYDRKGNLIQQRSNNLLGGYDVYDTSYDFIGEPCEVLHTHSNETLLPIGTATFPVSGSLSVYTHTDYCDNLIYENGVLKKIRIEGGYINYDSSTGSGEYCYYI